MTVLELTVPDMSCRRCVREVTARLRDVPGVVTVTVDVAGSHVTLTGSMTPADALAALAGTGYLGRLDAGPATAAGTAAGATMPRSGQTPDAEEAHR